MVLTFSNKTMSGKVDIQAIPASVMLCELINRGLYVS